MVSRSIMMLAALSARTSAFHIPGMSRTGYGSSAVRRITDDPVSRTRVGRLLAAVESPAVGVDVPASAADTTSEAVSVKSPFLQTLVERGFYHQCTNVEGLDEKLLAGEVVKAYLGFDATADRCVQTTPDTCSYLQCRHALGAPNSTTSPTYTNPCHEELFAKFLVILVHSALPDNRALQVFMSGVSCRS